MTMFRPVRVFTLVAAVLASAACGGDDDASDGAADGASPARSELVTLFADIGLDRECVEAWAATVSNDDARLLVDSFDSPDTPEGLSTAGEAALADLEACAGALAPDSVSGEPAGEPQAAADPGQSAATGVTYTASDICDAIDPDIVATAIASVTEIQQVDDTYCNVMLDMEGMGNSLNISIQPPIMPNQAPAQLFDDTVNGRVIIAGGDVSPTEVDGIGDRAAVIPSPQGNVVVAMLGDTVVNFDPMLASGDVTVEQWQAILGPALASL